MSESTGDASQAAALRKPEKPGGLLALVRNKFVKDTAFLWIGSLVTQATYIITSSMLARYLGPADYGRYELVTAFYKICFLITNFGLINVTIIRYSHATGGMDEEAKTLALAAFFKIYLIMSTAIVVVGFFLCPIAGQMRWEDKTLGYYAWALCVLGFIDVMRALAVAALQGARHMKHVAAFESAIALVRLMVLVLAVLGFFGLGGVIIGSLIAAFLSSLMGLRFFHLMRKRGGPEAPPTLSKVFKAMPRARMKDFFTLGFFIALNKNMMEIVFSFGSIFMAWYCSFSDTGHLRIACILVLGLQLILGGINRNILPTLGFRLGDEGKKGVLHLGRSLLKFSLGSGVFFIVTTGLFLLVVPWIVKFLYGAAYMESIRILMIICVSHLVMGFAVVVEPFYIYAGRIKTCVLINLILSCLMVLSGLFAAKFFGVTGVAWYLSVTRMLVIVHLLYIILYFRRHRKK